MLKCFGVGVGPANLSLACQLDEENVAARFVDMKSEFNWHEGMQIEGTTLQVSIFKDLVTLTNPSSPYTFLSYLHNLGRIYHFLNAQFDSISRQEFSMYLAWVSQQLDTVRFGETVGAVTFDGACLLYTSPSPRDS